MSGDMVKIKRFALDENNQNTYLAGITINLIAYLLFILMNISTLISIYSIEERLLLNQFWYFLIVEFLSLLINLIFNDPIGALTTILLAYVLSGFITSLIFGKHGRGGATEATKFNAIYLSFLIIFVNLVVEVIVDTENDINNIFLLISIIINIVITLTSIGGYKLGLFFVEN